MHWTYSRLSDYEKCPALYEGRYLARWPGYQRPPAPALDRGNKIHELMERAVLKGKLLISTLARWNPYIIALRQEWPVINVEQELALTNRWQPCDWKSWNMWWRGKMDVECLDVPNGLGKVVDWKTGGIYVSNNDQVRLYAGIMFERHPQVEQCEVELVYLDQKKGICETIARTDWPESKADFTERASKMLSAKTFPLKPGSHCSYCDFGPAKGGPCPAGITDRSGLQTDSKKPRMVAPQAAPLRGRLARQSFAEPGSPPGIRGTKAAKGKP